MFQNVLIAATILAAVFIFFLGGSFGVFLYRHKINASKLITEVIAEIPVFDQVVAVLTGLLPQPYKTMSETIVSWIKKACEVAEALCDAGQLTTDQRKTKALELVNSMLALEKITVTDKVKNAISLSIDLAAVLFVPHKADAIKTAPVQ